MIENIQTWFADETFSNNFAVVFLATVIITSFSVFFYRIEKIIQASNEAEAAKS